MSIKSDTAEIKARATELTPWTKRPAYVAHVREQIRQDREDNLRRQGRLAVVTTATEKQLTEFTEIIREMVPEDQAIPKKVQYTLADFSAKACPSCRAVKLREEFHSGATDCKPCANERSRDYHRRNPLMTKLNHGLRRAKQAGNHFEEVTPEALFAYWESVGIDPSRCWYTDAPIPEGELSLDHGQPIGKGGEHTVRNIFPTTLEVNVNRKRSMTIEQFRTHLAETKETN